MDTMTTKLPNLHDDLIAGLEVCKPGHGVGWISLTTDYSDGGKPYAGCALGVAIAGWDRNLAGRLAQSYNSSDTIFPLLEARYAGTPGESDRVRWVENAFEQERKTVPEIIAMLESGAISHGLLPDDMRTPDCPPESEASLSADLTKGLEICEPSHGMGWISAATQHFVITDKPYTGCVLGVALAGAGIAPRFAGRPWDRTQIYAILSERYGLPWSHLERIETLFEHQRFTVLEIIDLLTAEQL